MENIPKKFEIGDGHRKWVVERLEDGTFKWANIVSGLAVGTGHERSEEVVRKWLKMYPITKIYEEEKPVTRKYPDKFTMKSMDGGIDYEFVYEAEQDQYKTIYNGNPYYYDEIGLDAWTEGGLSKMIPAEYNGVDAEGKALNFTPDMLKPFMRVVTRNGNTWIAVNHQGEKPCFVGEKTGSIINWIHWYESNTVSAFEKPYIVEEVYEAPEKRFSLEHSEKGELIWKRQETKPVDESITKRLEWLQVHIDALVENMESLQAEYNELKQAVK